MSRFLDLVEARMNAIVIVTTKWSRVPYFGIPVVTNYPAFECSVLNIAILYFVTLFFELRL